MSRVELLRVATSITPRVTDSAPSRRLTGDHFVHRFSAFCLLAILLAASSSCTKGGASMAALAPMSGKRVEGNRGMVAASHPDAAAAGAEALRLGGNAVDAAVATGFALSVVDVSQTGLGGGGALTFYDAKARRAEHLSFYPRAGEDSAWARADSARARLPGRGAAVPGMVAGLLEAHERLGKLTRAQV
ncbi:MAG: gamma-glutamyltransferase, partial [Gemmatimonas sp.]